MELLASHYDPWVVAASVLVAILASYVALHLAERVRTEDRMVASAWLIGGSLTMGTGIWSTHFVGMQAFSLPIALGYAPLPTLLSWLAAVAVSALALWLAASAHLTARRLVVGALAMGAGICAMHYIGMAALVVEPAIIWNWWLVAASASIAFFASAAALLLFWWLRPHAGRHQGRYRLGAALLMGTAISGMHYCAMGAASFSSGTICRSADGLSGNGLGTVVVMASLILLALTLASSILNARMQSRTTALVGALRRMNTQLRSANEQLQQRALLDPLTHLPNRTLFEDRLTHAVSRSRRDEARIAAHQQEKLAVLFIDLDGFKAINESLGHNAGDEILKEAAERLRRTARDNDTVARISADEFVVL
ncbi:MAG TPA: MHYT domain-containing protein, partial [Burkholderiaceae bacterium]|nr:MHYT domain-containing protein [Burkholderiaceae bacterium]